MLCHLNAFQNGKDCLFVAVLDQIEQGGHTLPGGYTVELLRKASLAWLLPRELEYGAFGQGARVRAKYESGSAMRML